MAKKTYTHRTPEQWKQHIDNQAISGLSISTYCQQEGLAASNFYAWRAKLSGTSVQPKKSCVSHDSDWLSLTELVPSTASQGSDITLTLPGGISLHIRSA